MNNMYSLVIISIFKGCFERKKIIEFLGSDFYIHDDYH